MLAAQMKRFESKYGMTFEQYPKKWDDEDREQDYSFEAETDYLEWEALFTQIKRLQNSFAWMP